MPKDIFVRCLMCADLLPYGNECNGPLIYHLEAKHPYIHFAKVPTSVSADELLGTKKEVEQTALATKLPNCKDLKIFSSSRHPLKWHRKTSANGLMRPGKLFCPVCKKLDVPFIRRKARFKGGEGNFAGLMLGCWPFCFLPGLRQNNRIFDFYCRNCSYFIGQYDLKRNLIMNRPPSNPLIFKPAQSTCVMPPSKNRK